jgi:hypothetical protein
MSMSMQLALYDASNRRVANQRRRRTPARRAEEPVLCAACRAREARYGFRDSADDPSVDRPKTLCFDCFRIELNRRRVAAEQLARGWNATQTDLPLAGKLEDTDRRRRRAQIAARHALALR